MCAETVSSRGNSFPGVQRKAEEHGFDSKTRSLIQIAALTWQSILGMHSFNTPLSNENLAPSGTRLTADSRQLRAELSIRLITVALITMTGLPSVCAAGSGTGHPTAPQAGQMDAPASPFVTVAAASDAQPYFKADGIDDGSDNAVAAAGSKSVAAGANARATGTAAVAIGNTASAASADSVGIGDGASAAGTGAIAIGGNARASGLGASAIGKDASASGNGAFAAGYQAKAVDLATAAGIYATATGSRGTAIGAAANASGTSSVALGNGAQATRTNSVALGTDSTTYANLAALAFTPVGASLMIKAATAAGEVSVGAASAERRITNVAAGAGDTDAVNLSQLKALDSKVDGAVFYDRNADGSVNRNSFTLGGDPVNGGTVIHNVADGVDAHDAVNVGQLKVVDDRLDALAGSDSLHYFKADGTRDGLDDASAATGTHAVAAGAAASAGGLDATAVGHGADAPGDGSSAFGAFANAVGSGATAIGAFARAAGANATAIGTGANASGVSSLALGNGTQAMRDNSIAIGSGARATFDNSIALGAGSATVFGARSGYFAFALSAPQHSSGEVNVGNRTISGVAAGADDQDAVNVAQLKAVSGKADQTASRVEGAVTDDANPDATVNRDSITLAGSAANGGTIIHNVADGTDPHDAVNVGQLNAAVGDAISHVAVNTANPLFSADGDRDTEAAQSAGTHSIAAGANARASANGATAFGAGAVASGNNGIALGAGASASANNAAAFGANAVAGGTNAIALGVNSVASGNNAVALGAGASASADNAVALGQSSVADRANTVSVGSAGQERQIAHVAPGVQGTDAVNLNQLTQSMSGAVNQANSYTDDQVRSSRRDAYGGTASALAVAGLPQAVLPGRGMVAAAAGTYGGQSAIALGVSQLSETGKWAYKVQGTTSSRGEFGASIGAGMHW
ncbi:autotransporter adhesin [Paraburkholderia sp. GAS334]